MRTLRPDDLARCVELSSEAGWNQNEGDWRFLLNHGHGYGVEMKGRGLVATTGAWPMGDRFSWINMVLVTEKFRGMGLAKAMLSRCLMDTKARGQVALLDATEQGRQVYLKMGFGGERRLVRLKREGAEWKSPRVEALEKGWAVRLMEKADLPAVGGMDRAVLGACRASLLADLQGRNPKSAWVLLDAKGGVRGFLMGRTGRGARQLGPLVTEGVGHARLLMTRVLGQVKGPLYVDVPESHLAWLGELSQWGFGAERRFTRMGQVGAELETDWGCYYAAAGPDFA